ncbi:MAG: AAA family ATPase [Planctomycetia bacterium]|nr:AAA family ATPase [Planctomycetia bacterium]
MLYFDPVHGLKVMQTVPVDCFDGLFRRAAEKAVAYWSNYRQPPGEHSIDLFNDLEREDEGKKDAVTRLWKSIQESKAGLNPQFVLEQVGKLFRDSAIRDAITRSSELVSQGKLDESEAAIRKALDGSGSTTAFDFEEMTLSELAAADLSVEYLIEDMLVAQQPILMVGPMKSLKTSMMLDLCLSLATGTYFLGQFNVTRKTNVLVISGESGKAVLLDTLKRIARPRRIDLAKVDNLIISDRLPQLSNPTHLQALRQQIEKHKPEVLAIDPAYLALDGTDAANLMIFGQQIRAVSQLCQELGVALLLCHHAKKASGADYRPINLTDASWAGFGEHCRQWFLINHREKWDADTGTARLWLGVGGSAGHGGLYAVDIEEGLRKDPKGRRWVVSVTTATEAQDEASDRRIDRKLANAERAVIRAMTVLEEKNPAGYPKSRIERRSSIKGVELEDMLNALKDDGQVEAVQIKWGTRKKTHQGWRLARKDNQR